MATGTGRTVHPTPAGRTAEDGWYQCPNRSTKPFRLKPGETACRYCNQPVCTS